MTTPDKNGMTDPLSGHSDEFIRRPTLDRTDPHRNIFNAFRQSDGRKPEVFGDEKVWRSFQSGNAEEAEPSNGSSWAPGPLWDGVSESVRAGYDVINRQIEEGKATAARFASPDRGGQSQRMPEILERLIRTYSDIGSVWVELLVAATERDQPKAAKAPEGKSGSRDDVGVGVQVRASCPVTARARLYRPVAGTLTALPLRGAGPDAGEIHSVSVEPGYCVHVDVPSDAKHGTYYGILLEQGADEPAGSLTLTVGGD